MDNPWCINNNTASDRRGPSKFIAQSASARGSDVTRVTRPARQEMALDDQQCLLKRCVRYRLMN